MREPLLFWNGPSPRKWSCGAEASPCLGPPCSADRKVCHLWCSFLIGERKVLSLLRIGERGKECTGPGVFSLPQPSSRCRVPRTACGHQVDIEPRGGLALVNLPRIDGAPTLCQAQRIPQCKRRGNTLRHVIRRDMKQISRGKIMESLKAFKQGISSPICWVLERHRLHCGRQRKSQRQGDPPPKWERVA